MIQAKPFGTWITITAGVATENPPFNSETVVRVECVAINIPVLLPETASEKRPLSVNVSLQPGSEIPLTLEDGKTYMHPCYWMLTNKATQRSKRGSLFRKSASANAKKNRFSLTGQPDSINLDD